jgi:hypothetical protein
MPRAAMEKKQAIILVLLCLSRSRGRTDFKEN